MHQTLSFFFVVNFCHHFLFQMKMALSSQSLVMTFNNNSNWLNALIQYSDKQYHNTSIFPVTSGLCSRRFLLHTHFLMLWKIIVPIVLLEWH